MDMVVDKGKTRLLYLPGWLGGMVLFLEGSFWTLHVDPLLSLVLGIVPVYFFGQWFTQNIFAQSPLVATSPCPECPTLLTVYFGDLFSVQTDGIINGKPSPPQPQAPARPPPTPMRPGPRPPRSMAWSPHLRPLPRGPRLPRASRAADRVRLRNLQGDADRRPRADADIDAAQEDLIRAADVGGRALRR